MSLSRKDWLARGGKVVIGAMAAAFACVAYTALTLPDVGALRSERPQETAFMAMRAREAASAGTRLRVQQRWVPYRSLSPTLVRAVVLTEDAAFWSHDGVDYSELRAAFSWERFYFVRGASTITQQLAKNLYLSPSRNPYRKFTELLIARRLEAELSKTRILEIYLNVIEWGNGIWGAEAAARAYFGRSAQNLSAEQAALLAGAIINPRVYSPARPNARLLRRQQIILRRLRSGPARPNVTPAPSPREDVNELAEDSETGDVLAVPGDSSMISAPTRPGEPEAQ